MAAILAFFTFPMSLLQTRLVAGALSSEIHANQSLIELNECCYINPRLTKDHAGADDRVQHPCRDEKDHSRSNFNMDKLSVGTADAMKTPKLPTEKCMPPVPDLDFFSDMGRMNAKWRSTGKTHSLLAIEAGAEHWATIASLIETRKLNAVDPHAYLTHTLRAIVNGHKQNQIDELLPWNFADGSSDRGLTRSGSRA